MAIYFWQITQKLESIFNRIVQSFLVTFLILSFAGHSFAAGTINSLSNNLVLPNFSVSNLKLSQDHLLIKGSFNVKSLSNSSVNSIFPSILIYHQVSNQFQVNGSGELDLINQTYLEKTNFQSQENKLISFQIVLPSNVNNGNYILGAGVYDNNGLRLTGTSKAFTVNNGGNDFLETPWVDTQIIDSTNQPVPSLSAPIFKPNTSNLASFTVFNPTQSTLNGIPKISIYNRINIPGNNSLSTLNLPSISIAPNSKQKINFNLPIETTPGSYLVVASILNNRDEPISGISQFRYVISGPSGRIIGLTDTGERFLFNINLNYTINLVGPADNSMLVNSKVRVTTHLINIFNQSSTVTKDVPVPSLGPNVIQINSESAIPNFIAPPKEIDIKIQLIDHNGKVLNTYANQISTSFSLNHNSHILLDLFIILLAILIITVLIVLIIKLIKNRQAKLAAGITMLSLGFITLGFSFMMRPVEVQASIIYQTCSVSQTFLSSNSLCKNVNSSKQPTMDYSFDPNLGSAINVEVPSGSVLVTTDINTITTTSINTGGITYALSATPTVTGPVVGSGSIDPSGSTYTYTINTSSTNKVGDTGTLSLSVSASPSTSNSFSCWSNCPTNFAYTTNPVYPVKYVCKQYSCDDVDSSIGGVPNPVRTCLDAESAVVSAGYTPILGGFENGVDSSGNILWTGNPCSSNSQSVSYQVQFSPLPECSPFGSAVTGTTSYNASMNTSYLYQFTNFDSITTGGVIYQGKTGSTPTYVITFGLVDTGTSSSSSSSGGPLINSSTPLIRPDCTAGGLTGTGSSGTGTTTSSSSSSGTGVIGVGGSSSGVGTSSSGTGSSGSSSTSSGGSSSSTSSGGSSSSTSSGGSSSSTSSGGSSSSTSSGGSSSSTSSGGSSSTSSGGSSSSTSSGGSSSSSTSSGSSSTSSSGSGYIFNYGVGSQVF